MRGNTCLFSSEIECDRLQLHEFDQLYHSLLKSRNIVHVTMDGGSNPLHLLASTTGPSDESLRESNWEKSLSKTVVRSEESSSIVGFPVFFVRIFVLSVCVVIGRGRRRRWIRVGILSGWATSGPFLVVSVGYSSRRFDKRLRHFPRLDSIFVEKLSSSFPSVHSISSSINSSMAPRHELQIIHHLMQYVTLPESRVPLVEGFPIIRGVVVFVVRLDMDVVE